MNFDFKKIDFAAAYDKLQTLPGGLGSKAFQVVAGVFVPHAARMGFEVRNLTKKSIAVTMPDKRANRNHLSSLHAMALAHLGEFTTGLLLLYAVSPEYRTILKGYEIEYLAKARGTITGRASLKLPKGKSLDKKDVKVTAELSDERGTVVARTIATWRVGKV